ncbi:MAG: TlpA family protein disulfide reductase [Phycisphaerae bacterium]
MTFRCILTATVTFLLLVAPAVAQHADDEPDVKAVPESTIASLEKLLEPPDQQMSRSQMVELMKDRSRQLIQRGEETEREYEEAENLHEVRGLMLQSAVLLAMLDEADAADQARGIANRIVDSNAPDGAKAHAEFHILRQDLASEDNRPEDPAAEIRAFVDKYADTDAKVAAVVRGAVLANQAQSAKLRDDLLDSLEAHADDPEARQVLRMAGRHPDVGRPFTAELTRLNGEKLTLPDDLTGKVVVVDFWATWCGPCVSSLPKMKELYAKYNDRGVEFVGVSLDRDREPLDQMVRERELNWIQTYPGHETADRYGVEAIPSVWVVGKDGKVVSDSARENLESVIRRALQAETPTADDTDDG